LSGWTVQLSALAARQLDKLPQEVAGRVRSAIDGLEADQRPPGAKKLQGAKDNRWRLRVGSYRGSERHSRKNVR
jgi:mRNA-degrading endonuclease RelE of RelBE toxin-antitoxin system